MVLGRLTSYTLPIHQLLLPTSLTFAAVFAPSLLPKSFISPLTMDDLLDNFANQRLDSPIEEGYKYPLRVVLSVTLEMT